MTIFLLTILATYTLGLLIQKYFKIALYPIESHFFRFVVGLLLYTFLAFLLNIFFPFIIAFAIVQLTIWFLLILSRKSLAPLLLHQRGTSLWLVAVLAISSLVIIPLFYIRMFRIENGAWYSGGSAWGDMALHLTYINKFTEQDKINFTNPIYSQEKTNYPFLINYYTALLIKGGMQVQFVLILLGTILTLTSVTELYFLSFRISKSRFISVLTNLIFFFNGGLYSHTYLAEKNLYWSNIIVDYLMPQRGFLIGLSITTISLNILYMIDKFEGKKKETRSSSFWFFHYYLLVFLIGLIPMFHPHTFLVSACVYFWYLAYKFLENKKFDKYQLISVFLLLIISLPQIIFIKSNTVGQHFSRLNYGWMKGNENIWWFWLKNMGLGFIFLSFGNIFFIKRFKKYKFLKIILWPVLILFVICNFYSFQPNVYDNMKIMIYTWLATSIVAAILLKKVWEKNKLFFLSFVFCLSFSGSLTYLREFKTSFPIADKNDLKLAQEIKKLTPSNSIFLTADNHNHPIPMLTGRSVILGYRGWLWTHGIDYSQTETDVRTMFRGGWESKELLKKYRVNYVFISNREISNYQVNQEYFDKNFKKILSSDQYQLYLIP